MFDDRRSYGNPGEITCCGTAWENQQHLPEEAPDVVMLVMNSGVVEKLLSSKFTLGGDASVAAGPVGRTASANTDLQLNAEILSYSRSRGLFAGVALNGATLRPDEETNTELYGDQVTNRQIVTGTKTKKSAAGTKLTAAMDKYSLRNE
jgi:lipid-binding SYLF domain-containing protein